MLRVGLTGGMGSGKSTVAAMLARRGAYVLQSDELGRKLMQPGEPVYAAIAAHFGPSVVRADGSLDRAELARLAFAEGRVEELNALVHPPTIALQARLTAEIGAQDAGAMVVVESALLFETSFGALWDRFDRTVLVIAPEEAKVARFVARTGHGDRAELEAEARRRLARMIPDDEKAGRVDFVVRNTGSVAELEAQVQELWVNLKQAGSLQ